MDKPSELKRPEILEQMKQCAADDCNECPLGCYEIAMACVAHYEALIPELIAKERGEAWDMGKRAEELRQYELRPSLVEAAKRKLLIEIEEHISYPPCYDAGCDKDTDDSDSCPCFHVWWQEFKQSRQSLCQEIEG
jgi:hypothetical protein